MNLTEEVPKTVNFYMMLKQARPANKASIESLI